MEFRYLRVLSTLLSDRLLKSTMSQLMILVLRLIHLASRHQQTNIASQHQSSGLALQYKRRSLVSTALLVLQGKNCNRNMGLMARIYSARPSV